MRHYEKFLVPFYVRNQESLLRCGVAVVRDQVLVCSFHQLAFTRYAVTNRYVLFVKTCALLYIYALLEIVPTSVVFASTLSIANEDKMVFWGAHNDASVLKRIAVQ